VKSTNSAVVSIIWYFKDGFIEQVVTMGSSHFLATHGKIGKHTFQYPR
jgi:hypothetical protein